MTEEKKSVDVGPIWNNDHANEVAADWIGKNPGWEFRGEWRTTQPGVMSQIDVYQKQTESVPLNQTNQPSDGATSEYQNLKEILSDDEDTESGQIDKLELIKRGDVQKLLMQIPPDFQLAEINGICTNVFDPTKLGNINKDDPNSFDVFTNTPIPPPEAQYPLCCDPKELAPLGAGYSLFYIFLRNINIMFLVLSIICSGPCIACALAQLKYGDSIEQFDTPDFKNLSPPQGFNYSSTNVTLTGTTYATRLSVGTMFRNPFNATYTKFFSTDSRSNLFRADVIVYLNILGVVYMLIHSIFLRRQLVIMSINLDRSEISPSDYAILVRNLPKDVSKEKLKQQVELKFPNCKVAYVNLCYDITQMVEFNQKIQELSKMKGAYKLHVKKEMKLRGIKKNQLLDQPGLIAPPSYKTGMLSSKTLSLTEISQEMQNAFKQMEELGKNLVPGNQVQEELFLGVGIVVLESQAAQNEILGKQVSTALGTFLKKVFCFCCSDPENINFTYERAPEPSDVYWENLSTTSISRFFRVMCTYFATVIIIGICFGILWGINLAKIDLDKRKDIPSSTVRFLSFLCSFVITATNISLRLIVRNLSIKENHETYTAYNLSVAFKLGFVRFINTAIVPTVINWNHARWFPDGGLVNDYFSIMITVSLTDPILYVVDFGVIVQKLKQWYYKGQGDTCSLTQAEANELFQGSSLDMANQFANIMNLMMSAIFFHSMLPLAVPIACVGLFMNYWANKYVFLRRNRMPDQMSGLMAKFFANFIPIIALMWALDSVLVFRILYREIFYITSFVKVGPSLACIIFAIIFLLVPVRTMINNCFKNHTAEAEKTYDEAFADFLADYDSENPMSKSEGMIRIMQKRLASADITEEQKTALQSQLQVAQTQNAVSNFAQYSMQKQAMYSQMQAVAAPTMMAAVAMPMYMQSAPMMAAGGYGGAYTAYGGGYAAYGAAAGGYGGYAAYGAAAGGYAAGYGGYGGYGGYQQQAYVQAQPQVATNMVMPAAYPQAVAYGQQQQQYAYKYQ